MTYTLQRSSPPTTDEADAYARIDTALSAAVSRYNRLTRVVHHVTVSYDPSVPTAEASGDGSMRFGAGRDYMTEGTALHELAHTLGVGTTSSWSTLCIDGSYRGAKAAALLRVWDGANATLSCDHWHFWPYGLNYADEFSDSAFDRNVLLVEAMRQDGLTAD